MRFVIPISELIELLSKLQNIVAQKATIPILSNLLVEAANDELVVTATDLTVGIRCFTSAKIVEEGATTLPAKRFFQLARELTAPHIEISTSPDQITEVIANSSRFKIHGMHRREYPSLPDLGGAVKVTISQKDLKEALHRTAFAVSKEDSRFVLTGVFLKIEGETATFVGTDGKKLSKTRAPLESPCSTPQELIIPIKTVEEMIKNLDNQGSAKLYLLEDKLAMEANQTIIISKLLTGEYPDVDQVIPKQTTHQVVLHREELISLLRQISLFTSESNHSVRFILQEGELVLRANSAELGQGIVSMPINYHAERLEIAFNPTYFLEVLRHCHQEAVTLGVIDAFNPSILVDGETLNPSTITIHGETLPGPNPLYVLMPMRINEE